MNSRSSTAAEIAGHHDPDRFISALSYRLDSELPFDVGAIPAGLPLMLDTNVYIQRLKGRIPPEIDFMVGTRHVLHSSVACAELAISVGILDPAHPKTIENRRQILSILDNVAAEDIIAPSGAAWIEAAVIAGILARTQHLTKPKKEMTPAEACCQEGLRRKLLNDALIFLSAYEQNAVLVSTNGKDMDLLLRFRPEANVLLFN